MLKGRKVVPPIWEEIERFAVDEGLPLHDAVKLAIHHIVLEQCSRMLLSAEAQAFRWTLFGGSALRIAAASPRFSEDLDFCMGDRAEAIVEAWERVVGPIVRAIREALGGQVTIKAPKGGVGDVVQLRIIYAPPNSPNRISVHLHSQIYRSLTRELVTVVPPVPVCRPYSVPVPNVREMVANKIIALMTRNYLSGRDIFDVVHFSRQLREIDIQMVKGKMQERNLGMEHLKRLERRISGQEPIGRALDEWKRYLPENMQSEEAFDSAAARLRQIVEPVMEELKNGYPHQPDLGCEFEGPER